MVVGFNFLHKLQMRARQRSGRLGPTPRFLFYGAWETKFRVISLPRQKRQGSKLYAR
jgi:hypothetical protein